MGTCHPELSTWRPDAGTRASSKSFPKEASGWPAPGWRHLPSRTTPSSSLASTPGEVPCLPARSAAALWTTVLQFQTVWRGGVGGLLALSPPFLELLCTACSSPSSSESSLQAFN